MYSRNVVTKVEGYILPGGSGTEAQIAIPIGYTFRSPVSLR